MKLKTFSKQIISIIIFLGLAFFVAFLFSFDSKEAISKLLAIKKVSQEEIKNKMVMDNKNSIIPLESGVGSESEIEDPMFLELENFGLPPRGLPLRFKIPKIKVDALVENIGFTVDGIVGVPEGPNNVAWFNLGPRPGEVGSAVISGHSGWKNDIPAVFDGLVRLNDGDKIYVEDDKGSIIVFRVREFKIYGRDDQAPEVFISNDGKAHLNLVTCTGVWNEKEKSRSNRLVVFTDKVEDSN